MEGGLRQITGGFWTCIELMIDGELRWPGYATLVNARCEKAFAGDGLVPAGTVSNECFFAARAGGLADFGRLAHGMRDV